MKRDMDLIRKLLIFINENSSAKQLDTNNIKIDGYEQSEIAHNLYLMGDRGLLEYTCCKNLSSTHPEGFIGPLLWEGEDFLKFAKDESIWAEAKAKAGAFSFEVFKKTLIKLAGSQIGL